MDLTTGAGVIALVISVDTISIRTIRRSL